jgi:hypothetical protein
MTVSRHGYSEQEITAAAHDLGVTVDLSSLVRSTDPGADQYDLRATIRELCRRELEQQQRHRGAMGFVARNRGGMSAYEHSGWEDHADGYLFDSREAKSTALDLAAIERKILGEPQVLDMSDLTEWLYRWLDNSLYNEMEIIEVISVIESNELHGKPHAELLDLVEVMLDEEENCCMFDPPSEYLLVLRATLKYVRGYVGLDDGEITTPERAPPTHGRIWFL